MTTEIVEPAAETRKGGGLSDLFGRGLLYVVVWSLQIVSATLVSPVLAYLLGPSEFGQLASAIALHQVLIILAILGLDQALVQQRAEDGDDRTARGLVTVGTLLATGLTVVVGLTGPLWATALGFDGFSGLLVATVLWTAPGAAVQMMLALLLSQDRFRVFAAVSCLSAVGGQLFGIALLLGYDSSADVYAWGGVISQFAAMVIGFGYTRPALRGLLNWGAIRRAATLGVPLSISTLFMFVLNAGDRVIIQRLLGPEEVGRYQVAYTVGYVVVLLMGFCGQAWTPRIAAIADETARWQLVARSRDELYRLLVPVTIGITLAAPVALRVVAPSSFRPDSLVFVVFLVALSAFPVAASTASGKVLVTTRRTRPVAVIAGVAALVNVAVNIALLRYVGIAAAAGATVVAFALQAVLQRRAVPRFPDLPRTPTGLLAAVFAACVVSAASTFLPQTVEWNVARFAVALACLPWFWMQLKSARQPA
jgi:O-antigen/teichoic acid export membrane protein